MTIVILPSARDDLADGRDFYENKELGLGVRLEVPVNQTRTESGTALPHSRTCRSSLRRIMREASWSAAVLCRFGFESVGVTGSFSRTPHWVSTFLSHFFLI